MRRCASRAGSTTACERRPVRTRGVPEQRTRGLPVSMGQGGRSDLGPGRPPLVSSLSPRREGDPVVWRLGETLGRRFEPRRSYRIVRPAFMM